MYEVHEQYDWQVLKPKNAHGSGGLTTPNGVERFVQFALQEPDCGGILVLLDGDAIHVISPEIRPQDDCSPALAQFLSQRISALNPRIPVVVVVVRWEYEAWFLASLRSIAGKPIKGLPGLPETTQFEGEVEEEMSPKGWIEARFPPGRRYSETRDQVAMTSMLDFALVKQRSRSFRRLKNALRQILDAHAHGESRVTPVEEKE